MALSVVPDAEPLEIEQAIIAKARNGARPVDLEREFNKSRQQIRRILKNASVKIPKIKGHQNERALVVVKPQPVKDPPKLDIAPKQTAFWGHLSSLIGTVLLALGLFLNWQYWFTMGGPAFGAIGVLIDVITAGGPTLSLELFRRKTIVSGIIGALALLVWVPIAGVSLIASAGFTGMHIGQTVAENRSAMGKAANLDAMILRKEIERKAVDGTDLPENIEVEIQKERAYVSYYARSNWISSKECTDTTWSGPACKRLGDLWRAKRNAERRIELDTELASLHATRNAMPVIESADPASERISKMIGGSIKPENILDYVMNVVTALPALASLFFAIAARLR